ncbi:Hypothetical Protein FCC1311_072512 [Hondaea fermentalgiana]|uniref:Uncharacterized protein n=1 Tax=Hondaea fermentalgiana TaxID=2315210 RepID=A0A2R5GJH2_9STRA|nr:Hypothetical Protein FCC1311_072512 [Hondaea fermentalgiana]|eukprot:GBG31030.1 Hypothetical Protein FCC1311_072512 [Hondaea fermentalgiana]
MGAGLMSERTIELIREIRALGVHFVYVTGARKSTLEVRLPIMGCVDAAFAETGGRYLAEECSKLDESWTSTMEAVCGPENTSLPPLDRTGDLWDWARMLDAQGYVIDARSYYFGFRVDLDKQEREDLGQVDKFREFVDANMPSSLATAMNLGKFDFFPKVSGKGNAVRHYLSSHGFSADEAVALFDDENDLPMADAVGRCFVMQATHPAIEAAVKTNPNWHVATSVGVLATEEVLSSLLAECRHD